MWNLHWLQQLFAPPSQGAGLPLCFWEQKTILFHWGGKEGMDLKYTQMFS